jgi:SAM-dependent methyltransferase
MTDGGPLWGTNITYRRPALYDDLTADDGVVEAVSRMQVGRGSQVRSVLDLGCGTGRHAAGLSELFGCSAVGVDIQAGMVDYGRNKYCGIELRQGDLRRIRLGRSFDLVTCLGNSLAYLHTDDELALATETFAAHTNPGALLVVMTLMNHGPVGQHSYTLKTGSVKATVEVDTTWDPVRRLQTTRRTWHHQDGSLDQDLMERRVLALEDLQRFLRQAGFSRVETVDDAGASSRSGTYVTAIRS